MNNNNKPSFPCTPPPYDHSINDEPCNCNPAPMRPDPMCPIPPVKPVPPMIQGYSIPEAMNYTISRVNECIRQWNEISGNCFQAMNECVAAARMNDVYYDDCEVHYQEGYSTEDSCTYSIIEKKSVDRHGKPIFVKLGLAYDNSTNSGVKQPIFDVSFIKRANMVITAVPTSQNTWNGPAVYQGAPIPGTEDENGFVYGFNRHGALKWFGANVTQQALCQNQMVDVIGGCIPAITDGSLTTQIAEYTKKGAVTAIGWRNSDNSTFFFQAGNQDQPGMAPVNVAKLLLDNGCTTGVITSFIENENLNESNGMLYLGQMCQAPTAGKEPENLAYWYITKGPCFNNSFRDTIAELVQQVGKNAWRNYLLGVEVSYFDERITQNYEDIQEEIARAMQAENWLQENINKEVERAMTAEGYLQTNINAEVNRATAAEQAEKERAMAAEEALDAKIEAETTRATNAENDLHQQIVDETSRAKQAETANTEAIAAEKLRAQTRENEIQTALDSEIAKRIAADNDIINAIEQEVLARRAADTALQNSIDATKNELKGDIQDVQDSVNSITGGQTNLPYLKLTGGTLSGPVNFSSQDTITLGRGPTADMEAATKLYVDNAVAAGGGGGSGGDVSKEYVDEQISNVQSQIDGKVSKTGDTMTGALNMDGQSIQNAVLDSSTATIVKNGAGGPGRITNLATPTANSDAVNKEYVDTAIADIPTGDYVPTEGGSMTGDLNMDGTSQINFNDPAARMARVKGLKAVTPGAVNKGIIGNQGDNMVITSISGDVNIVGDSLGLASSTSADIPIVGAKSLGTKDHTMIDFTATATNILGPVDVVNAIGDPAGEVTCGLVDCEQVEIGNTTLKPHTGADGTSHLDINVNSASGAIYVNRMNDGTVAEGGTGEINVTEVHAPQELRLNPGTSINAMNHRITGVNTATQSTDAVNKGQLDDLAATIPDTSSFLAKSGGTMTGPIAMSSNKITGLASGSNLNDAVNLSQLNNTTTIANNAQNTANTALSKSKQYSTSQSSVGNTLKQIVLNESYLLRSNDSTIYLQIPTGSYIMQVTLYATANNAGTLGIIYVTPPFAFGNGSNFTLNYSDAAGNAVSNQNGSFLNGRLAIGLYSGTTSGFMVVNIKLANA